MADVVKLPPVVVDQPVNVKNENFPDETKDSRVVPAQGQATNSHHHDSEYDTASDLEGGEDDDYEDEDDESLGADGEEDDGESENGSIIFDVERQRGDGQETDYAKKVDEDRSNPQYIPKRGTFYEHDDRTADAPEGNENLADEAADGDTTKSSTPTISTSSKTTRKWQQASAVDRWSHDRYDENEQAPKSRAELVSAYGYDIRNEDGPPRARRRRKYGRGPTKYSRNWEDENAYIKSSNAQRKPRPEDFPALGDKKGRKSRSFREEKENRYDRHGERGLGTNKGSGNSQRDNKSERRSGGKSFRSGRQSMDFKNQNKNRLVGDTQNRIATNRQNDNMRHVVDESKTQVETVSFTNTKAVSNNQSDRYNGHEVVHANQLTGHRELTDKISTLNTVNVVNSRQSPQTAQIASRLQIQSRNDPSHVGSVQMHSLVTQNQPDLQQPSSEAARTKRYSSLRQRTQNETVVAPQPTSIDQHSLQQIQLHEHHQQQQQPTAQHVLLQDQHLLQANLMQLYHTQENLQAQMQSVTLQTIPASHQAKPQYQNVQQQYQAAAPAAPAFYAPAGEFATAPASAAPQSQYPQPQPNAYIQQQSTGPQMAFNAAAQSTGPPASQPLPPALNYVQTPQNPTPSAAYQNYSGYQNYNTVNTVGGTTYFVPQQQPPPRPVVIPQRRPTNAIPILAPPTDKSKPRSQTEKEDENKSISSSSSSAANAPIGSAENIDHILDNMFVQRPPYQPPTRKSSSPATESVGTCTNASSEEKSTVSQTITSCNETSTVQNCLEDSVKNLTITEELKPTTASDPQSQGVQPAITPPTSTPEVVQTETG